MPEQDKRQRGYILKLNKFLYVHKQGPYNWFEKLNKELLDRGFRQSKVDSCVVIACETIVLVHVDDCLIVCDKEMKVDNLVKSLHDGDENLKFTDKESIDKCLGVDIQHVDSN